MHPFDTLKALRATYPTHMTSPETSTLLNTVAWVHKDEGWRLHEKSGGERCPFSPGVEINCGILCNEADGQVFDVLRHAAGEDPFPLPGSPYTNNFPKWDYIGQMGGQFVYPKDPGGTTPDPPDPPDPPDVPEPPPVIPYDEGKSIQFGLGCNDVYTESGASVDPGMVSVHSSRAAWDHYVGGLAWEVSYRKHINEFRAVYGLPPV